jgi:hypothetical protein
MNMKNEKSDFRTSEQFSKDLQPLFEPKQAVSPHVDRAVMDAAARRLRHRDGIKWKRYACAAAAMIAAGVLFLNFNRPVDSPVPIALKNDINQDGAVDILDALALAREIQSAEANPQWDMNGDSAVNQEDVDMVAMAAVKLKEGVL